MTAPHSLIRKGCRDIFQRGWRVSKFQRVNKSTVALTEDLPLCCSTNRHSEEKDFQTTSQVHPLQWDQHWNALLLASAARTAAKPVARQMDLVEAIASQRSFDKLLLLVQHGECQSEERDPELSKRGIGQVLNLARRTATFVNRDTGLVPDLVVVAPLRRTVQTAMLSFPHYSPNAVRGAPWICHAGLLDSMEEVGGFPGSERFTPVESNNGEEKSLLDSKKELLWRADDFLEWIKARDERVIVVVSQPTWLQAFCGCTLDFEGGSDPFKNGELKVAGVNF